jgi:hypothetical protein
MDDFYDRRVHRHFQVTSSVIIGGGKLAEPIKRSGIRVNAGAEWQNSDILEGPCVQS